jgi:hypothetical protein
MIRLTVKGLRHQVLIAVGARGMYEERVVPASPGMWDVYVNSKHLDVVKSWYQQGIDTHEFVHGYPVGTLMDYEVDGDCSEIPVNKNPSNWGDED